MPNWSRFLIAVAVLFLLGSSIARSADAPAEQVLIGSLDAFKPAGTAVEKAGRFNVVAVEGQKFEQAVQAETIGSPENRWDVMLQAPLPVALAKGDTLVARFWVRTVDAMADDGMIGLAVELNHEPWTKLGEGQYNAPRQWTQIQLPFVVDQPYEASSLNVNLRLGYPSQKLEIGGVQLVKMPADVRADSLPRTVVSYRGMEPDATWRREALDRIERNRKADLHIVVRDASGKPAAGQAVHVKMTKLAFAIGTAVDAKLMLADNDSSAKYRAHVESSYNTVVYENDLKWPSLAADPNRYSLVDQTLPWFAQRDIAVRGHVLVWPASKWLPPAVAAMKNDPPAMRQAIADHITQLVTRYKGRLVEWDVLNEPFNHRELEELFGRDAYVEWFKLARAADPNARLFINDFGILETGNRLQTDHQKFYEELIADLIARGAPIDGIGIQGHFGSAVTDPEKMLAILDRFAKFGKPIRITELDVNMLDPQQRANFLRDVMLVCFSHPSVDGVVQWGFWEGRHWLPGAALYSRNWDLRPHGEAFKSLVSQWTTDVTVLTGPDGSAGVRGYVGDYLLTVGEVKKPMTLTSKGGQVEMELKQ